MNNWLRYRCQFFKYIPLYVHCNNVSKTKKLVLRNERMNFKSFQFSFRRRVQVVIAEMKTPSLINFRHLPVTHPEALTLPQHGLFAFTPRASSAGSFGSFYLSDALASIVVKLFLKCNRISSV